MFLGDWRYRHAALMAVSACGEGCHVQMEKLLPNIMEGILPYLKDSVSIYNEICVAQATPWKN